MCSPASDLRADFTTLTMQLHLDGFRPLAFAYLTDLRAIGSMVCGRCGREGLDAHPFYKTTFGEAQLGPCRMLARCPACGETEVA